MSLKLLTTNQPKLKGTITVPGDKSISHRSIMFGAISEGKTTISNFLYGDDCKSTIACFRKLGVDIEEKDNQIIINGKGFQGLTEPVEILDVGNSGTTTRLLLGILAGRPFHAVIIGDDSIAKRPMNRVTKPLRAMGASINGRDSGNYTPLAIQGGNLQSFKYEMPVASAQVKSSLLFAALQAEGETTVIEKMGTRDHTERMIKQFGGNIDTDKGVIKISGNQKLIGTEINVPGDISSAAFFMVAATILKDSEVTLHNIGLNPTRTGIIDVLIQMGAAINVHTNDSKDNEPTGTVTVRYSDLKGIEIGGELIPRLIDELPIIALLATQASGKTVIKDAEELKVKETNRIDAVVCELTKLGADIEATDDGMIINGKSPLHGGTVKSYGDHRIGMMLSIASLLSNDEVQLENASAISVSYPTFFDDLNKLIH